MIEKGTIMESEAEPSSKELLKIYDTTLAEKLMQKLLPMIENCAKQTRSEKVVVAVSGGSGSGKTVTALLLSCFLKEKGIENYILSGDAYPHRIPKYNDAERLQIFRENVSGDSESESVSQFFHILGSVDQQRGCCEVADGIKA